MCQFKSGVASTLQFRSENDPFLMGELLGLYLRRRGLVIMRQAISRELKFRGFVVKVGSLLYLRSPEGGVIGMGHLTPVEGSPGGRTLVAATANVGVSGRTLVAATASAGVNAGADTLYDERSDRRDSSSGVSSITEGSPDCVSKTELCAHEAPSGGA